MRTSICSISRSAAWAVWALTSIFYAYQYILRVMPSIMLEDISAHFSVGAAAFGQFSGVYYIGYSLMHLPIGILLDRFGPKKIMPLCIFLTVLGMLPLLLASHWVYPVLGRFFIGIGSSAAILGVFKVIRMTFSEERFPRMLSVSVTIGLIGAIYGGAPLEYMRELWGYRTVIELLALLGILLALISYFIVPDVQTTQKSSVFGDIKEVLKNKRVLYSCIFAGLMVGPLEGFADVWGIVFFKYVYGFDVTLASTLPSLIFVGMCFGSPVLNLVAEKMGCYLRPVIASGALMALCFSALLIASINAQVIGASFILVGVCCAYQILAIYKVSTYVREGVAGLATALANMIIMTFGYVFHGMIGGVINMAGGTNSPEALIYGVAVIPVALCVGTCGFCWLVRKERASYRAEIEELGNLAA